MSETDIRLYFMGLQEEMIARTLLDIIKHASKAKEISVADWALVHKDEQGKLKISTDKSVDPGPTRGALFGGGVIVVLAALGGPVGIAAVAGGAVIGAAVGALKDSGLKDKDLEAVSGFMDAGRTGLVVAVPLDDVERFDAFTADHIEFEAPDRRFQTDITAGHSFQQAIEEYRATQGGGAGDAG